MEERSIFVQQFSSSCTSETDPQADTTSHQPLLAYSACAECNYAQEGYKFQELILLFYELGLLFL